jgi:hypothetical protein
VGNAKEKRGGGRGEQQNSGKCGGGMTYAEKVMQNGLHFIASIFH